jgi:hypothetical protein
MIAAATTSAPMTNHGVRLSPRTDRKCGRCLHAETIGRSEDAFCSREAMGHDIVIYGLRICKKPGEGIEGTAEST